MQVAYQLARQSLPDYTCKFSRHDFTLPQLFACLAVKELLKRTYRGAEAVLRDAPQWCRDIGLDHAPDHNTLWRAATYLLKKHRADRLLDRVAQWAAVARMLGLSTKPLVVDSTTYESHHVSRHYERRCHQTRKRMRAKEAEKHRRKRTRADTVRSLPKLAIGAASHSHLILSVWTGTGLGSDHPHFEALVYDAWRRVPNRSFKVAADAGYDSEPNHRLARHDMSVRSLIPPEHGRPSKTGAAPSGRWRRQMKRLLSTTASRRRCGFTQRWQVESVNSMMKRNLGSALGGKSAWSRKRDMHLKVLTHDVMILKPRVETEHDTPVNAEPREAPPAGFVHFCEYP